MADHNDIYSIVERLRILEEGLDKNQRSVNQLGATFKPKTVAVLTAKTDPKNPLGGKMVGDSVEDERNPVEEDVLDKVKKSFTDFIKSVEDKIGDSDIKEKKKEDTDLKKKDKKDSDLVAKEKVAEDPTEEDPVIQAGTVPTINPTYAESAPVKTFTLEDGTCLECYGDEERGFEIRRGGRQLPTRFKDLDQATMALEMFQHHCRKQNDAQDYIDEA